MKRHPRAAAAIGALLLIAIAAGANSATQAATPLPGCPTSNPECLRHPQTLPPLGARGSQFQAAPKTPAISVVAIPAGRYIEILGSMHFISEGVTLRISGSGFAPGKKVALAAIDTSAWRLLSRGSILAEAAFTATKCPGGDLMCWVPNPAAGTFVYRMRLYDPPNTARLEVMFRSSHLVGTHNVTMQSPPRVPALGAKLVEQSCLDGRELCPGFGASGLAAHHARLPASHSPHRLTISGPTGLHWWHEPDSGEVPATRNLYLVHSPITALRGSGLHWWHEPDSGEIRVPAA